MIHKKYLIVIFLLLVMVGTVSADITTIYSANGANAIYSNNTVQGLAGIISGKPTVLYTSGTGTAILLSAYTSSGNYSWWRSFGVCYNTSMNSANSISSAKIGLYLGSGQLSDLGTFSLGITNFSPVNPASLSVSDWLNPSGGTRYINDVAYSSSSNYYLNMSMNAAGLSAINKSGYTCMMARFADVDINRNTTNVTWGNGKWSSYSIYGSWRNGITNAPFLEITYTPPDTTPPASITNLANNTATCEQINWTWTNPADVDYGGLEHWWNGALGTNITAPTVFKLFTGLTGGTNYTFSTKTYDTTGNLNSTFVNMTAVPTSCTIAPVANFTADNTTVCLGSSIQFNDTSTNTPTSWAWDFGDTGTSTIQNATHTYASLGSFTVFLNATNTAGSNTNTKSNYITVNDCSVPVASFTNNVTCGVGNLSVLFNDTSIGGTSWYWNLGDGNTSVVQNLSHLYGTPGQFTVLHNATNAYGTSWSNRTNLITVAVNGTFCTAPAGNGTATRCSSSSSAESPANPLLAIAGIGIVMLIARIKK